MIVRLSDQQAQYLYDTLSQRNTNGFDKTTKITHDSIVDSLGSKLESQSYAETAKSIVMPNKYWLDRQTKHYEEPFENE